ncbi:MAG: 16S rRNA (guanine(966)-N(2))-methyltransferase RsmD [Acidimicrobiales bacterium]
MRVVAGTARGRRIDAPPGTGTRPTSDRVRESIFNSLGSLGLLDGATVVDLFAGSGAMGIEALSRGAASAVFVESDRRAAQTITANLERCGLTDRGRVVPSTVERYLDRGAPVDLALVDPPYAFDGWADLLGVLEARHVVVESDRVVPIPDRFHVVRERAYGSTVVQIATRTDQTSA